MPISTEAKERVMRILTVAYRDFASLKSEKTIVVALLVQLVIAGFSSFLVVGIVSVYDTGQSSQVSEVALVETNGDTPVSDALINQQQFSVTSYNSAESAIEAVKDREVHGAVITSVTDEGKYQVQLYVAENSLKATLLINRVKSTLEEVERVERTERTEFIEPNILGYPPNEDVNPYYTFTYTVLIPLLVFLPVFLSGSIAVDTITEEIEEGTFTLLRSTPLSVPDIMTAKVVVTTILGPAQLGLWILLMRLNGINVGNPGVLLGMTAAMTLLVVTIGAVVSMKFQQRRQAQFVYSVALIGLFGVLTLLPFTPVNMVARLAIGSSEPAIPLTVLAYGIVAVCMYGAVTRLMLSRMDLAAFEV